MRLTGALPIMMASLLAVGGCDRQSKSNDGGGEDQDKAPGDIPGDAPGDKPGDTPGDGDAKPDDPATPGPGTPDDTTGALRREEDCAKAWDAVRQLNPVGLVKVYEKVIEGAPTPTSDGRIVRRERETVLESAADHLKSESATQVLEPDVGPETKAPAVTTREDYLKRCVEPWGAVPLPAAPPGSTIEVLDQTKGPVTVRAGTFDALYLKLRIFGTQESRTFEAITETWTIDDGSDILVRTADETKVVVGGFETVMTSRSELTELTRP